MDGLGDARGGNVFRILQVHDGTGDLSSEDQGANFSIFEPGILSKNLTSNVPTEKPKEIQVAPIVRS
jgi:hypothetical protein